MLLDRAVELGLCNEWQREWNLECTRQELVEKYLKGIDFCIKHDYPNVDFIREYFPKELLERNGVFVDGDVDGQNLSTVVLLGKSNGVLLNDFCVSNIYVRHSSLVSIQATNGARVFVEVYDNSLVTIAADESSKVFVYQHGGTVKSDGNVVIRDRR